MDKINVTEPYDFNMRAIGNFKQRTSYSEILKLSAHRENNFCYDVSPYDLTDLGYIVNELAYHIAEEIVKSQMFSLKYEKNVINDTSRYSMDVYVAQPSEYGLISDYGYCVNDKWFTNDEIQKAIENTYPEKFI